MEVARIQSVKGTTEVARTSGVRITIVMAGKPGTGKTSLIQRFGKNTFTVCWAPATVADLLRKKVEVDGKTVRLDVLDTSGVETCHCILPQYFRDAQGVIFVYDVTRRDSFIEMETWLDEVQKHTRRSDIVRMLIGNKIDKGNHAVTVEEGVRFARQHQMLFFECSAKTNAGVELAFQKLTEKIIATRDLLGSMEDSQGSRIRISEAESEESQLCGGFCSSSKKNHHREHRLD